MPKYLSATRLKASVDAISNARGKIGLMDFLMVKRTLAIRKTDQSAITQSQPAYVQAAGEFAAVANKPIDIKAEKQIFNVFSSQHTKGGFRYGRYISNGTNSTIAGNPWQAIIEFTTTKPREARLRPGYEAHLADVLLKEGPRLTKPILGDVAIWNYRYLDIEPILQAESDPTKRGKLLEARFIADYALTLAEIGALFETSDVAIRDQDLEAAPADPVAYLPGLTPTAVPTVFASSARCSLDLVVALSAKPFVILSGTSGTGKSRSTLRLAEELQTLYADSIDGQIFRLVPIGPDWTSPKRLLGYRTPFGQARVRPNGSATNESYEITDTLRIILRACNPKSTKVPHFLVFDEMNLSHVERYFAPFLSLMEASTILEDGENAPIVDQQSLAVISEILYLEDKDSPEAESARLLVKNEQSLTLPPNLFYVGTVNVDESTYMFSPKVLDRAHVLEVRALLPSEYVAGKSADVTIELTRANELLREAIDARELGEAAHTNPAAILDLLAEKHGVDPQELDVAKSLTLRVLDGCFQLLAPTGFEFAYRVVKEIHGYMLVWVKAQLAMGANPSDAMKTWVSGLDRALFQKVLPKIHGNRSALGDCLKALAAFLAGGHAKSDPPAKYALGVDAIFSIEASEAITLPDGDGFRLSRAKLLAMHDRLVARNYVSFVK